LEDYIPVLVVTVDIMANRGIPVQLALMGQAALEVPPVTASTATAISHGLPPAPVTVL